MSQNKANSRQKLKTESLRRERPSLRQPVRLGGRIWNNSTECPFENTILFLRHAGSLTGCRSETLRFDLAGRQPHLPLFGIPVQSPQAARA